MVLLWTSYSELVNHQHVSEYTLTGEFKTNGYEYSGEVVQIFSGETFTFTIIIKNITANGFTMITTRSSNTGTPVTETLQATKYDA